MHDAPTFGTSPPARLRDGRLGRWLGRLADLPSVCAVCHEWPARPLCEACVAQFAQPEARCRRCALPLAGGGGQVCGECLRHPPPLDYCVAACRYAWPWTECVVRFKFRAEPGWAAPLATLMRSAPWAEPLLERAERVLPMPLSAARLRERGFNQALLLARRLAGARADPALLLRTRDTPAQHALPRAQRLRNLRGAFALEPLRAQAVHGQRVLLVDDVMTTGASLYAAAEVLRAAGATEVAALVLARTDPPAAHDEG